MTCQSTRHTDVNEHHAVYASTQQNMTQSIATLICHVNVARAINKIVFITFFASITKRLDRFLLTKRINSVDMLLMKLYNQFVICQN